jgi:hypothetical protein
MKNKDFAALSQRLLPDLPGFAVKAPLIFIPPVKHTLRGIYFESHSYETTMFYVWAFFLPLCVPTKYVGFNLGKRIENPGGGPWSADSPNLLLQLSAAVRRDALPFVSLIESPRDLARAARSLKSQDPYTQQAVAYAFARAGDIDEAVAALDKLMCVLDLKTLWQFEMAKRAITLKAQLLTEPAGAQKQLQEWESESVRNLGLENFR